MSGGLDTSVVLRLLTGQPPRLSANAVARIHRRQLAGETFVISDLVLSEAYFALQDYYGIDKADCFNLFKNFG